MREKTRVWFRPAAALGPSVVKFLGLTFGCGSAAPGHPHREELHDVPARQQCTVPFLLQRGPATLDRIGLAAIRRRVNKTNLQTRPVRERRHAAEKLSRDSRVLRAVVERDDTPTNASAAAASFCPPQRQAVSPEVAAFTSSEDPCQQAAGNFQHAERNQLVFGRRVVVPCVGNVSVAVGPRFFPLRVFAQFHFGFRIHRDFQCLGVGGRCGPHFLQVVEDGVGVFGLLQRLAFLNPFQPVVHAIQNKRLPEGFCEPILATDSPPKSTTDPQRRPWLTSSIKSQTQTNRKYSNTESPRSPPRNTDHFHGQLSPAARLVLRTAKRGLPANIEDDAAQSGVGPRGVDQGSRIPTRTSAP